ncbi:MAG TPA: energy-coupling factor transporter transmembrane component T [Micromonosporaceae bacterium]|nr:energy-coupling factor transporter transmembrane component T [Micromonosporaceae bacterium]
MRLGEPIADRTAPLARRNPVAKLAAAFAIAFGLLVTLDPVAPAVALVVEIAVVPLFGVRFGALARRAWPLLFSMVSVALVQLLFGTGDTTAERITAAAALALRVLAVALPGVLVMATVDATDLADALIQQLRVPARFAIGALAAFRLLPLLAADWQMLTMARRARGVSAGRSPTARVRLFASTTFGLLVGAIRRATRLATAMEARGFDAGVPRTSARRQRFTWADGALAAGGVAVAGVAVAASVALGMFRTLL